MLVLTLTPHHLTWRSFDAKNLDNSVYTGSIETAIKYLYDQLSTKHNEVLFKHAMAYLQQAGGLSEVELTDILSLDDEVLQSVFQHYLPPREIFRLPNILWIRIRNDMHKYLVEKDVDGVPIIYL